ncbi:hypothetical protein OCGS_0710 [Oceaniovalibus guishaninsula JLT2003]|uniref:DUF924 domain-containing protein n=1 Tax=Oceaniovalibus guishaninsula JLT2003 TaxID=1231392 RepID=K2I7M2_9RHOB|nr:DUF924 family protein [Oceaniovalibus guishaninsula]EKE45015.1 hypothetical protein OCGS_0710 [Oceaniovalibus guishaninsula JLT2003]
MPRPDDVLRFWLDEVGPDGWYVADDALDATIRDGFGALVDRAADGGHCDWATTPRTALAYLVVADQFSRNVHRGDGRAYAADRWARAIAKLALRLGWDMAVPEPGRQFFYLPLMHAESLQDQERGVRLILLRMPRTGAQNLLHARAHREVIRRFGRFPHRNADLGRATTAAEAAFLDQGGYGGVVRRLQEG